MGLGVIGFSQYVIWERRSGSADFGPTKSRCAEIMGTVWGRVRRGAKTVSKEIGRAASGHVCVIRAVFFEPAARCCEQRM
jgi:hypothetical protein